MDKFTNRESTETLKLLVETAAKFDDSPAKLDIDDTAFLVIDMFDSTEDDKLDNA